MASVTTLKDWLSEQPFMLGLSSGFFGFFAHAGVVSALEHEGLRPYLISGSSAGALVGALWASGVSANVIQQELTSLKREDFWDPGPGLGLLKGRLFRSRLEQLLVADTFEQCQTKVILSAFDVLANKVKTFSRGPLSPAIHASCAVPFLFQPVWIGFRPYLDGGVKDRHGISGIPPEGRLLYHHLASRSPWRRKNSPALKPPKRKNTVTLIVRDLPRLGPFKLDQASNAFDTAREKTLKALDEPVKNQNLPLTIES